MKMLSMVLYIFCRTNTLQYLIGKAKDKINLVFLIFYVNTKVSELNGRMVLMPSKN